MTISEVSGNTSTIGTQQTPAEKTNHDNTAKPAATQKQHDTVHITPSAQAKAMKQAGQTAAQIARLMGIDIKTVNDYLGIQTTVATATTAASKPTVTVAATPSTATPAAKVDTKV